MKGKNKLLQKRDFCTKGKVHVMREFLSWTFRRWKIRSSFDSKSWCKIIFSLAWNTMFSEYGKVLVLNFSEMGNTFFFWFKKLIQDYIFFSVEYHVFWIWKSSCFDLFRDRKYVFLWSKKLVESWCFLGTFELFVIFQDLGNMVFRAVLVKQLVYTSLFLKIRLRFTCSERKIW